MQEAVISNDIAFKSNQPWEAYVPKQRKAQMFRYRESPTPYVMWKRPQEILGAELPYVGAFVLGLSVVK